MVLYIVVLDSGLIEMSFLDSLTVVETPTCVPDPDPLVAKSTRLETALPRESILQ